MKPLRRDFSETVIAKIDKTKKTEAQKAREAKVRADAYAATQRRLLAIPADLRDPHVDGELDAIRDLATAWNGPASASSQIAKRAEQAIVIGPNRRERK